MNEGFDPVMKPVGYNSGEIECIDAIRSALTLEEWRGALKFQVLKYTWRERYKNADEDMEKAKFYLRMLLGDDPRLDRVDNEKKNPGYRPSN